MGKNILVSGGRDKLIKVWDLSCEKQNFLYDLRGHMNSIDSLDRFPNNVNRLVSSSLDATLMVWDLARKKYTHILQGHSCMVTCVKVVSDELLASGSLDKTIKIWNIAGKKGVCLRTITGHIWPVLSLEWRSNESNGENGGFLLSGSSDNTIRMWSIESGECVKVLSGHTDDVFCLKLINTTNNNTNTSTSSDRHLVSGSFDGCLRVWNLRTGLCIRTIKTNTPIYKLVFSSFLF